MEQHFPKMIPKHCEVCKKTDGLLRCGGCKTYYYCGREHQTADRPTHRTTCKTIKDSRTKIEDEEAKIRARPAYDLEMPVNVLDDPAHVGRLWTWQPVRPYLHEMLIRSWRQQGIEDALAVYLEILRLNINDNQGARFLIPALYMRLGRNQEAYDFLKGWALHAAGRPETKELENPSLMYLHVKNADPTEGVDLWTGRFLQLAFMSSIQLLKTRLGMGLDLILEYRKALPPGAPIASPREILADVHGPYCGDIIERFAESLVNEDAITKKRDEVDEQLADLFVATAKYNEHFWPMMLQPAERDFSTRSLRYTFGSREEAHLAFTYTYPAWCETPMALETLRATVTARK
ncbi:hypothetical protein NEMBOFW57_004812 [Staphylotrichum longicolle]|uniref:MYND-type domain-containing protein n=1 Tax=Staphylotrichum longicolle TaxID=669026 RepID=A0AAD4EW49_9PEZI|nr:hypothetical protein NEMBOFW57_004812 [Staphylotrichum longicolle]